MATNETPSSPSGAVSSDAVSSDAVSSDAVSSDAVSSNAVSSNAVSSNAAKARPPWMRYVALAVIVVLASAGFSAVSFYGAELSAFWNLRAWNKGAAGQVVTRFSEAVQKQQMQDALALVDTGSYTPLSKDNKVIGLEKVDPSGMGRYKINFKGYIPPGTPQVQTIYMITEEDGRLVVSVRFGDGSTGDFLVKRAATGYKITAVPLSMKPPL